MIGGVHILTQQTSIEPFFPVIIFSSRNWCVRILTRQTVIWDLFQPSVRWLYLSFAVVIFSGGSKNIAGQMTVPFFLLVIFLGCNWCLYFDTNINYGTYDRKKLLSEKKVQLSGRLCFLAGSNYNRKNYNWKKRYSRLANGSNKSRLLRQTTNTNYYKTGKNYDQKKRYSRLVIGWSTKHKTQHTQTQQPTRWAVPTYPKAALICSSVSDSVCE